MLIILFFKVKSFFLANSSTGKLMTIDKSTNVVSESTPEMGIDFEMFQAKALFPRIMLYSNSLKKHLDQYAGSDKTSAWNYGGKSYEGNANGTYNLELLPNNVFLLVTNKGGCVNSNSTGIFSRKPCDPSATTFDVFYETTPIENLSNYNNFETWDEIKARTNYKILSERTPWSIFVDNEGAYPSLSKSCRECFDEFGYNKLKRNIGGKNLSTTPLSPFALRISKDE